VLAVDCLLVGWVLNRQSRAVQAAARRRRVRVVNTENSEWQDTETRDERITRDHDDEDDDDDERKTLVMHSIASQCLVNRRRKVRLSIYRVECYLSDIQLFFF